MKNKFLDQLKKDNFIITDQQIKQLDNFASFLIDYNNKINLTAITDIDDIYNKHFYDSYLCIKHIEHNKSFVDVGTGAGFPGVVVKILCPNMKVVLVETLNKRCKYLQELINYLDLKDITVINKRGEDFSKENREKFDIVTARAVTNLANLIEICGALVKKDGLFLALRAQDGKDQLQLSNNAIKKMGFEVKNTYTENLFDNSLRYIFHLSKQQNTPGKYPRAYSIIKSRPL